MTDLFTSALKTVSLLYYSSGPDGLAGGCIVYSMGQSGCVHLSPVQSDQDSHQLSNGIPMPQ